MASVNESYQGRTEGSEHDTCNIRIDTAQTETEKGRSSYLIMLENIANDLDTFLTGLCHINNVHSPGGAFKKSIDTNINISYQADMQEDTAPFRNSSQSLDKLNDGDPDVINDEDSRKHRIEPTLQASHGLRLPLLQEERYSPLTSGRVTTNMDERRPISTEEKLEKTRSIWLLISISRAGAVHILKDMETGIFIVRKSSRPDSLALSVQSRLPNHCTVDHYLIESTKSGFKLQGSAHFFHSIPSLLAYYVENMDEIPYHLRLPSAIQQAKSTRELASLDLLGQDFWVSSFSKKLPSSKKTSGLLTKSCSEPIHIQRTMHSGIGGSSEITSNNLPTKSVSDSSQLVRTHANISQYPQSSKSTTTSHTMDSFRSKGPDQTLGSHQDRICRCCVQDAISEDTKTTTGTISTFKPNCMCSASEGVSAQLTRKFSLENPTLCSSTHKCQLGISENAWTIASDFVVLRRQQNSTARAVADDLNVYSTNPSNQLAVNKDDIQKFPSEHTSLFNSLPPRHQHCFHNSSSRNQTSANAKFVPESRANLYFTTNLDLLELPENSYFTSKLSDRMSDYEDIWRNSSNDFDGNEKNTLTVGNSQLVLDANNNNNSAEKVKEKIVSDVSEHSSPSNLIRFGHENITMKISGLTALEQARIIAGSSSDYDCDDDIAQPDFKSEAKKDSGDVLTNETCQWNTSVLNKNNSESVMHTEADIKTACSFVDFNEHSETDLSFRSTTSEVFAANPALSNSTHSFTTSIPVNGTRLMVTKQTNAYADSSQTCERHRCTNVRLSSRLDNLSRKKSSSESSLVTASSPPYAEPADAVRLRDKSGKDINIQIRRRSAPSSVSFRVKDRTGKNQQSKVSQFPELETIFSPDTQSNNSSQARFIFDIPYMQTQLEQSRTGGTSYQYEKFITSNETLKVNNQIGSVSHKKDKTKILTHNNPSFSRSQYLRTNLAAEGDSDNIPFCISPLEQTPDAIMSPMASRFPVVYQQDQRISQFSESSTMQDLILCVHPELSVPPKLVDLYKHEEKIERSPLSEYDNLDCHTHPPSSIGTIYSPPWDTSATSLIIDLSEKSCHQLLPSMNIRERIEHWQQANNGFCNRNALEETASSHDRNSIYNKSIQTGKLQAQQHDFVQQQLLIEHQEKIKTEERVLTVPQACSHVPGDSFQHSHENLASGGFTNKEEQKKKRWSYQGTGTKRVSPPPTPQSTDDLAIRSNSKRKLLPPLRLSSQCPDVVNCHNTLDSQDSSALEDPEDANVFNTVMSPVQMLSEAGILHDKDGPLPQSLLAQQMSVSQTGDGKTPGTKIQEYIVMLSGNKQTIFGCTVENFIQCTVESHEKNPQFVMRNVRQFMSGIKNYLVKHGEGDLKNFIEMERNKLGANEILNIDAIIEQALHVCVLKPLKYHIYKLFVDTYSKNGALEQLARNIKYARTMSTQDLGVKPGLKLPQRQDMEIIKSYLDLMQKSYSPLQKLQNLLKATSAINNCAQVKNNQFHGQRSSSLGADDFLPTLIHVIVQCGLVSAEIEADFMWGLLHPSLLAGESGYYLTTLSSAVLILKNLEDTHNLPLAQVEGRLAAISDMKGFLKIAIPDELNGTIRWRTLPVRPNMTARDVCAMLAHKLKVTNPQDYGLFILSESSEKQLADSACPQMMKCDNQLMKRSICFAFKRIDANIAWPRNM